MIEERHLLADGNEMPMHGLGLYKVTSQDELTAAMRTAWENGYRLFDTAQMYNNEAMLAQAIHELEIPREDIFITTKVSEGNQGYDQTLVSVQASLKALSTDYVDLLLVHWPLHQHFYETWRAFEHLKAEGLVRSIGTSNYGMAHLQLLAEKASVMPAVNQVELHPNLTQKALLTFDNDHDILTQAWAPLGRGTVLNDAVIAEIAQKYNKSAAQVVLRWHVQNGVSIIPKSVHAERVAENGDIYDFELSGDDMLRIDNLNRFTRISQEPELVYENGAQYPH